MKTLLVAALIAGCSSGGSASGSGSSAGSAGSGSAKAAVVAANAAVIDALEKAIDERYSYRDRLGLDWKKLFADARPGLLAAATPAELAAGLETLLSHAQDPHIWLTVEGTVIGTDPRPVELNIDIKQVLRQVSFYKLDRCINWGTVSGYAYVLVNGLEKGKCDGLVADWKAGYPKMAEAPGLILDLRGNAGGNEVFAQQIAGYFVDKPTPYASQAYRDPSKAGGFTQQSVRVLDPAGTLYGKPVVVLTGQWVMSSGEGFVLMMRAAGATLIGARTRGASGNPKDLDLGQGIHVNLPSWKAMTADGTPTEGVGIAPDIELIVPRAELEKHDAIIDAAVTELDRKTKRPR